MLDFINKLELDLLKVQGSSNRPVCLVRDFNVRNSAWYSGKVSDSGGKLLEDFASINGVGVSSGRADAYC